MQAARLELVPEGPADLSRGTITTKPVDAADFAAVVLDCEWTSMNAGASAFAVHLEESSDGTVWSAVPAAELPCGAVPQGEARSRAALQRRWLRLRVALPVRSAEEPLHEDSVEVSLDRASQVLRVRVGPARGQTSAWLWCAGHLERRVA